MKILPCPLADARLIQLTPHGDARGSFSRLYCEAEFAQAGLDMRFVQTNISANPLPFTLRGMHRQEAPHGEDKLVTCVSGAVWDVIVDMRPASPTYGRHFGVELAPGNNTALLVPKGFAHGFLTLKPDSTVIYQVSHPYVAGAERGLRWNDPAIGIQWPAEPRVISDKDAAWPDVELKALTPA